MDRMQGGWMGIRRFLPVFRYLVSRSLRTALSRTYELGRQPCGMTTGKATKTNMKKIWNLLTDHTLASPAVQEAARAAGIPPVAALLLQNRGFDDPQTMRDFLSFTDEKLHDPFLLPDMERAVDRLEQAIARGEKGMIYGDYDVDGVTSVSVLYLYLKSRGLTVDYYIPDRNGEGYGINNGAVAQFAQKGVTLMVTVDTGVTAVEEVAYARTLGIDTVVTDHHECQAQLPEAAAVVNPHRLDSLYPFKELAGVGVVFKLICAMELKRQGQEAGANRCLETLCDRYLDLVAMGTVADVMPLVDENRLMVRKGLALMSRSPRPGITALLTAASGRERKSTVVTATDISFTVAPRINAAGRIASAGRAVELFLSDSAEETGAIAAELCAINRERQECENSIIREVSEKIREECDLSADKIIVLADDHWHHGVIGIVASRITERYGLPSILISFDGNVGKGSGRSVKGLNLVEALTDSSDLLIKFGGHELAAGLSITREQLPAFRHRINEYVKSHTSEGEAGTGVDVDCILSATDITVQTADEIALLEPFGVANPMPLFLLQGATIRAAMVLGEKHTKFLLEKDGITLAALRFGRSRREFEFYAGDTVDVIFQLGVNEFRGTRSVQLLLKGIRLSSGIRTVDPAERLRYDRIRQGEPLSPEEDALPTRDDLAVVYLFLKRRAGNTRDEITGVRELLNRFESISYLKLRLVLTMLEESGLVTFTYSGENQENFSYTVNNVKSKVDMEATPTYSRLKGQGTHR